MAGTGPGTIGSPGSSPLLKVREDQVNLHTSYLSHGPVILTLVP